MSDTSQEFDDVIVAIQRLSDEQSAYNRDRATAIGEGYPSWDYSGRRVSALNNAKVEAQIALRAFIRAEVLAVIKETQPCRDE